MDRQPGMSFEILNTNPVKYGLVRILDVNKKHTRLAVRNVDSATDGGSHRLKQNVAEADGTGGVCPKLWRTWWPPFWCRSRPSQTSRAKDITNAE